MIKKPLIILPLVLTLAWSCASDNNDPQSDMPVINDPDADIVYNRLFHYVNVDSIDKCHIPLNVIGKIDFTLEDGADVEFKTVANDDGTQYAVPVMKRQLTSDICKTKMKVSVKGHPELSRNLLLILYRTDDNGQSGRSRGGVPIERAYSSIIGKGTQYHTEIDNTTKSVILYDKIDVDDEMAVIATPKSGTTCFEFEGEDYHQTMNAWHMNLGVSAKIPLKGKAAGHTLTGSFGFGRTSETMKSESYEYYLNIIQVKKMFIRLDVDHFFGSEFDLPISNLEQYVNPDMVRQFFRNERNNNSWYGPEGMTKFLDEWGCYVITSGLFGGYAMNLYGRSENCYHTSVGYDAHLTARHQKTGSVDSTFQKDWAKIYLANNKGQYQQLDVDFGITDDNYEKASRAVSYSVFKGGANSMNAETWLNGFDKPDNWTLISYSEEPIDTLTTTQLTCIADVLDGMVDYYETYAADPNSLDQQAISQARSHVEALRKHIVEYVQIHKDNIAPKKRLVLADAFMKKGPNNHQKGEPRPFVAENPRYSSGDQTRWLIYYPMMANKNAPCDKGYAVDTSQDKYFTIVDKYDHYWYYALAPEDEVTGITSIKFLNKEKDGFHFRGDHPDQGGISVTKNYLSVKYYDGKGSKLTGFGLYHKGGGSSIEPSRIISSSGGTELSLSATSTEITAWETFWNDSSCYEKTQWAEGAVNVNYPLWPCMTTKPLTIKRLSNKTVTQPKKWGE